MNLTSNPLIVQSNSTLLLEVNNPLFREARDAISAFAHLEKSPEHIHTYVITPLSLWNAASLGVTADKIVSLLTTFSKYPLPQNVVDDIAELTGRFGKFILEKGTPDPLLFCAEPSLLDNVTRHPRIAPLVGARADSNRVVVPAGNRGALKQAFISLGFPVHDRAGYVEGEAYQFALKPVIGDGTQFTVREYQRSAAESFAGTPELPGGSGVVVLPCGAGKTVVGMYVMSLVQAKTLVLVTSVTAAHQWKREFLDKTTIPESDIGEYSGESKEIRPITIATYQILTYRSDKNRPFVHFGLFNSVNWGLIVYDEVHLLPAPIFKITADLQSRRRLGLTATLVREDGHESDVFTLIGPKKYDVPWKDLERQGWIATAKCIEIRVDLAPAEKLQYFALPPKQQVRLAYENSAKTAVVRDILKRHPNDLVIIIGQYLTQINEIADEFKTPLITGSTPNKKRDELYAAFRCGKIKVLTLSKVGNFAVDLPDANVLIQISGSYGSRQEEAQRLGRILRPKKSGEQALFYSVVTRESKELDFAMKRQLFLTEQGYSYEIRYWDEQNRK